MVRAGSHTYGSDCSPVAPSRVRRNQPAAPVAVRTPSFNAQSTSVRTECRRSTVCLCCSLSIIGESPVRSEYQQLSLSLYPKACQWRTVSPVCWNATRRWGWKQHVTPNHLPPPSYFRANVRFIWFSASRTNRKPFYLKIQSVPRSKHTASQL
jgi:hypothetical protein